MKYSPVIIMVVLSCCLIRDSFAYPYGSFVYCNRDSDCRSPGLPFCLGNGVCGGFKLIIPCDSNKGGEDDDSCAKLGKNYKCVNMYCEGPPQIYSPWGRK